MNRGIQQIAVGSDATTRASDQRGTARLGKRNFLRLAWILALCLSMAGWMTSALFLDKTTWIDPEGFLHEPLFGLIPMSYFFLFVAIVLAAFDVARKLRKRR